MNPAALFRLAWRDSRSSRRRLALYMSAITLGVAALVAIDSFAANVTRSVRSQSRTLLGGDMVMQTQGTPGAVLDTLLDSLSSLGVKHAADISFPSMALAESSGSTRLVDVHGVGEGYPFFGGIETEPRAAWEQMQGDTTIVVDPALLIALDVEPGEKIRLGFMQFTVAGVVTTAAGDAGIASMIGPRVYVAEHWLKSTGLLDFGSRAQYKFILKLPQELSSPSAARRMKRELRRRIDPQQAALEEAREARSRLSRQSVNAAEDRDMEPAATTAAASSDTDTQSAQSTQSAKPSLDNDGLVSTLPPQRVRIRTLEDTEQDFTDAISRLADFLSIIGLLALLIGGIGVASGINAFVASRVDTVAILRCLGATTTQVMTIYVIQATAMGLVGAAAGAALGVGVQFALPHFITGFLPVDVSVALEWIPLLTGLIAGVWVALVFALRPLLALRQVSPLQAIRRDADALRRRSVWRDLPRLLVNALLVLSVALIVVTRIGTVKEGLGVTIGILLAVGILWAAATVLVRTARHATLPSWPLSLRQGIANLHRPANQTRAVTLALGFGAFLLSTVYLVQTNMLTRVQAALTGASGNLLFFDVQDDQIAFVDSVLTVNGNSIVQRTPIITMRIDAINGKSVSELLADSAQRRSGWVLRREFRSTYRDSLGSSERLIAGKWFGSNGSAGADLSRSDENLGVSSSANSRSSVYEVSLEQSVARDIGASLGDTITWNVQGVPVRTVVTSLREVDWGRFEANFYAVFQTAALEHAPGQFAVIANVPSAEAVAVAQRDVVRRFPNVSSIDLSVIRKTIADIVSRVSLAIRFLGVFSLAMGIPVLFSAVAATRRARLREGVLLRTLGATRAQVARIMLVEYAALGLLGALTGLVLSFGGAWGFIHLVIGETFIPAVKPALVIAGAMVLLTITIGLLTSRDVYRETPMSALRDSGS